MKRINWNKNKNRRISTKKRDTLDLRKLKNFKPIKTGLRNSTIEDNCSTENQMNRNVLHKKKLLVEFSPNNISKIWDKTLMLFSLNKDSIVNLYKLLFMSLLAHGFITKFWANYNLIKIIEIQFFKSQNKFKRKCNNKAAPL